MPISLLLNWRVWAYALCIVLLAMSHWKAYHLGSTSVRAEWAADQLSQAEQTGQLQGNAARATEALQADANKLRRTKDAQIAKLNTDLAGALDRLRDRPARPGEGDLPSPTGVGPGGCTGAGLFRPDAEFLTRKAAQRDAIAVLLAECQAAYGNARNKMN
jgi:hypothetical protein